MIETLGLGYKEDFLPFGPFPKCSDREKWAGFDEVLSKSMIAKAEAYLGYDYPSLTASMFLAYSEGGDRSTYQKVYSQRRQALNTLVIAECLTNEGRYVKDIINGIYTICEESAWNLPAHNTYVRDSKGPVLPDHSRPVLALFSCETGSNLAIIKHILQDQLDKVSPLISKRIGQELERRILNPYLKEHFWWMGQGDEPMNNWTIWCSQSILITFFLSDVIKEDLVKAFRKVCKSVDFFLKEYAEDGCCDEGALYYRKAGLCLMNTLEILNGVTDNHFSHIYEEKKIYNMAAFILNMQVEGQYYINFADCSAVLEPSGVREYLFGKRTGNQQLMTYAARDFTSKAPAKEQDMNLYHHLQSLVRYDEVMAYDRSGRVDHPDVIYDSAGIAIVRDDHYCLAVKAGHNADSHNHNDVGSYTLFLDGLPFIVDIGVETYTAKTFSPRRYEIWTMQSDYHNLPTINGTMQLDGEAYLAKEVTMHNNAMAFTSRMDIASAYPAECGLEKFYRTITFTKGKDISILDEAVYRQDPSIPLISNMILYQQPTIVGHGLNFEDGRQITLRGAIDKIELERLAIIDERLKWAWDHDLYRVRIYYSKGPLLTEIRRHNDRTK